MIWRRCEMGFLSVDELFKARASHMDNLRRLKECTKYWEPGSEKYARAESTMANLMQQVYALDEQLGKRGFA